ncbi:methyltransferase domain-containing protein [Frankia sp. AgB1.9]|uniref:class I SAM-dependent methyltransferase n=1 Tax=unclassified Frankia TaxID=2632575 RepID=UPI00193228C5|nr:MULTISPECIES: methyltransferase domain-containing protein [unclassified Frankia]MBL7487516.1 methyltransferase domain-containing protein [Frankia sp. AgW1.1]MBL7547479.1 methyltransferase domain-containing protein [Frankia sp. AgB1.9]MBL7618746.1 methyltransferase domain-containing protein [Frankia sp. AgB1.8]
MRRVPEGDTNLEAVLRYYDRTESRLGYLYLLRGTKHFGWYEAGDSGWRFSPAMRRMEHQLGDRLGLDAGSLVLDAGCGMGEVARTLAVAFGLDVTGIDILGFNLDGAGRRSERTRLAGHTRFVEWDYHDLSRFEDGTFDGAYTMETFVHAADPERVLAEFHRVLRTGGRLVMFEYSRTPAERLAPAARAAFDAVCALGAMPAWHRLNHGDLENLLESASFKVESVEDVTVRMLPMLRAFAVLGRVPYALARRLGKTEKAVNAMSGVEMWKHQEAWRYNIYTATKKA